MKLHKTINADINNGFGGFLGRAGAGGAYERGAGRKMSGSDK